MASTTSTGAYFLTVYLQNNINWKQRQEEEVAPQFTISSFTISPFTSHPTLSFHLPIILPKLPSSSQSHTDLRGACMQGNTSMQVINLSCSRRIMETLPTAVRRPGLLINDIFDSKEVKTASIHGLHPRVFCCSRQPGHLILFAHASS